MATEWPSPLPRFPLIFTPSSLAGRSPVLHDVRPPRRQIVEDRRLDDVVRRVVARMFGPPRQLTTFVMATVSREVMVMPVALRRSVAVRKLLHPWVLRHLRQPPELHGHATHHFIRVGLRFIKAEFAGHAAQPRHLDHEFPQSAPTPCACATMVRFEVRARRLPVGSVAGATR